jgi:phosphomevalonate kinase
MVLIIAISGKMGCGKDFITTNYIIPYLENVLGLRVLQLSFADQLKVMTMVKDNICYNDLYVEKTEVSRRLLQINGTENARTLNQDIWIKYVNNWIEVFKNRGIRCFVIPDLRFLNEFEWVKSQKGIVIRIKAPERNKSRLQKEANGNIDSYINLKSHKSECDLDDLHDTVYDYVIRNDYNNNLNDNLPEVYELLDEFVKNESGVK